MAWLDFTVINVSVLREVVSNRLGQNLTGMRKNGPGNPATSPQERSALEKVFFLFNILPEPI